MIIIIIIMMMMMMMMIIITMIIIITIILIALKGANRYFLQSSHCAANCFHHVRSSGQDAIVCESRAAHRGAHHMQHVVCHVVRRDRSATTFGRAEIAFSLALFYWLKRLTDEGGEETGVPGENPRRRHSETYDLPLQG